jgi:hypothetical protein
MGRHKLEIDPEKVEMLAEFGCSTIEIARLHSCDEATIRKRFKAELQRGREQMKVNLRRLQWRNAENGSNSMLIFLGKNYLGQNDSNQLELVGTLENLLKGNTAVSTQPQQKDMGMRTQSRSCR